MNSTMIISRMTVKFCLITMTTQMMMMMTKVMMMMMTNANDEDPLLDDILEGEKESDIVGEREEEGGLGDAGTASVYATDSGPIPIPQHIHYSLRGHQLASFSLYEYAAIITIVPIIPNRKTSDEKNDGQDEQESYSHGGDPHDETKTKILYGRPANSTFNFAAGHPLATTHVQRLRSKTVVPIAVGRPPRCPPIRPHLLTTAWKKQASNFARYMLVLFRPWNSNGGDVAWTAHMEFILSIHDRT